MNCKKQTSCESRIYPNKCTLAAGKCGFQKGEELMTKNEVRKQAALHHVKAEYSGTQRKWFISLWEHRTDIFPKNHNLGAFAHVLRENNINADILNITI